MNDTYAPRIESNPKKRPLLGGDHVSIKGVVHLVACVERRMNKQAIVHHCPINNTTMTTATPLNDFLVMAGIDDAMCVTDINRKPRERIRNGKLVVEV